MQIDKKKRNLSREVALRKFTFEVGYKKILNTYIE